MVLAGDNYTGFAARRSGKRRRGMRCSERRENEKWTPEEREKEREKEKGGGGADVS